MKEKLSADFERRLFDLEDAIRSYRETGNIGSLFPRIFSVVTACWCRKPIVKFIVKSKN